MLDILKRIFSPVTATLRFIGEHFKAMLFLLLLFLIFAPSDEQSFIPNNLQKITLEGPIFEVADILDELERARTHNDIKGVLFVINSPGGAVAPSIEIAEAIKRLQHEKPVVVYGSGMLASGGYYAAIWANEIIANPGAMIGSIGVIMQGANFSELMEKIGIETQVVKAGRYKQVGTADRAWTDDETAELEKVISGTYDMFVEDVAKARGLNVSDKARYADAHIFTAAQAKAVGLIDTLGVEYDAQRRLEALSGVAEPLWNKEDRFDKFIRQMGAESISLLHIYFPALSLR